MPDTQRKINDALALMPVGEAQGTSVQDVRDAIYSLVPGYGEMVTSAGGTFPIAATDTYYALSGGTWTLGENQLFDMNTSGQLRYIGTVDMVVMLVGSLTARLATGPNKQCGFAIMKNGLPVLNSIRVAELVLNPTLIVLPAIVKVSTNDYIELYGANGDDTEDITVDKIGIHAVSLPML